MARMTYDQIKQKALELTTYFETSTKAPDCFGIVAGNFDEQGISWGCVQFNFGQGTLQPIFTDLINEHPQVVRDAFTNQADHDLFVDLILNKTLTEQIAFGDSISNPSNKSLVIEPWKTYFFDLGITQESIDRQVEALESYYANALTWFHEYKFWSRRAYALMFDISIQNGGIATETKNLILNDFEAMSIVGKTKNQIETERMRIVANRRAEASATQWIETVRGRKLAIANGTGWVYNGGLYMDTTRYDMTLEEAFPPEKFRIYIDAGYGGTDTGGTLTGSTTLAKDITLDIALKLRNILLTRYTGHEILL